MDKSQTPMYDGLSKSMIANKIKEIKTELKNIKAETKKENLIIQFEKVQTLVKELSEIIEQERTALVKSKSSYLPFFRDGMNCTIRSILGIVDDEAMCGINPGANVTKVMETLFASRT